MKAQARLRRREQESVRARMIWVTRSATTYDVDPKTPETASLQELGSLVSTALRRSANVMIFYCFIVYCCSLSGALSRQDPREMFARNWRNFDGQDKVRSAYRLASPTIVGVCA